MEWLDITVLIYYTFYYIPRCWYPIYVYIHIYLLCFSCKFLEPCMGWWRLAGVKYRREFDTCCRGELGLTASSSKINKFKHKQHIYIIIIYIVYNSVYIHILIYIDISCTILYVFILSELIYIYIIIPNTSLLHPFLVNWLWFRYFLEPKLWRWTRTLAQAFLCYFFIPEGSKRFCISPNAINVALESAPLRSF
jgi:hypothetical protein